MRKTILIIALFLMYSNLLIAQEQDSDSQQGFSSSLTGSVGYVKDGIGFMASYNYYRDNEDFIQGSFLVSIAEDKYRGNTIPYNIFTVNLGYFKPVYTTGFNKYKLAVGGGLIFGYEAINDGNKELPNGALINSNSGFIYGGFIGADFDIFLNQNNSLSLKVNEYYHANSEAGKFLLYMGVGFRYFLN